MNEKQLTELHSAVCAELKRRVASGTATHEDMANAIRFLKNNGDIAENGVYRVKVGAFRDDVPTDEEIDAILGEES